MVNDIFSKKAIKVIAKVVVFDFLITIMIIPFLEQQYGFSFVKSALYAAVAIAIFAYIIHSREHSKGLE